MTRDVELTKTGSEPDGAQSTTVGRQFYLSPGRLFVSTESSVVTTVLGSCVSVCLWDEALGFGGLNHYLLPDGEGHGTAAERFASVALTRLLENLIAVGAVRANLNAKVFGGACVLDAFRAGGNDLGTRNVEVARAFLEAERIPITAEDVGGRAGRKLRFHTWDGSAWVRKL